MTQQVSALPELCRMKAQRGFFAPVDGKWTQVRKGEVVNVQRDIAIDLRISQKAFMTEEPLLRIPEQSTPKFTDKKVA